MGTIKISALTAAASALAADEYPVNEAGTTKKVTGTQLRTALGVLLNTTPSGALTPAATVRTYLAGSAITVPASKIAIGSTFFWEFDMTKTAAGSATSTFDMAVGTLGTTGDTARLSWNKNAGTAAAEAAYVRIVCQCRGPLSASGIFTGTFVMVHTGGATGLTGHLTNVSQVNQQVSAAFDVTTANLILGICLTSGAADAITIQQMVAYAVNL